MVSEKKEIGKIDYYICIILFVIPPSWHFFDLPGRIAFGSVVFFLAFFYYISDYRFRKIALSYPLLIWILLTVYHLLNGFYHNVPEIDALDFLHQFKIYACIVIVAYWACIDKNAAVRILLYSFLIRCVVGLLLTIAFVGLSTSARMTGFGGSATLVGQAAAITGIFIMYSNIYRPLSMSKNAALFLLPLAVIVFTQSRNSLAMLLIAIFVSAILFVNKSTKKVSVLKSVLISLSVILVLYLLSSFFMDSHFAQRSEDAFERNFNSSYYEYNSTGTFFDIIVGDRLIYYVMGWKLFLTNPLTGIGLRNYMWTVGGEYPLHSEYMIHLCEGGIIGICIWILFVISVIWLIIKYSENPKIKFVALSSIGILLFCGIYAREFYYEWFYPVYGLALSSYMKQKYFMGGELSINKLKEFIRLRTKQKTE